MRVLLVMMLTLCLMTGAVWAEQKTAAGEPVTADVMPLSADPEAIDLQNGTFCVCLEDFSRMDEEGCLTLALYLKDEYAPEQIEHLMPGMTILVNGQKYTVARDVAPREIPFDDEAFIIWDIVTEEECGGGLWFTKVGENYLACLDDWIPCHLAANVQVMLPLPDRFVLYENPDGEEVVAHTADDFLTWLREGGWDVYNQYNSTAKFENGELVSISVSGYPHGPETGDTAADD